MNLLPVGPFQYCAVGGSGALAIDPLTLSPILYLDSLLGLNAFADGANVTPAWPDQSGHANDAGSVFPAVMRRSGPHASANGGPALAFNGADAPSGSNYAGGTPSPWPSTANGRHYLFYGRFSPAVNSFHGSLIFTDGSGARPTLIYETVTTRKYAEQDTGGTHIGNTFAAGYGLMEFIFNPPNDGTGIVEAYFNGIAQGINGTWTWVNNLTSGYVLGANLVDNVACVMDLCTVLAYSFVLTAGQRAGINAFLVAKHG